MNIESAMTRAFALGQMYTKPTQSADAEAAFRNLVSEVQLVEYVDGFKKDVLPRIKETAQQKAKGARRLLSGSVECNELEMLRIVLASQIEITNTERRYAESAARKLKTVRRKLAAAYRGLRAGPDAVLKGGERQAAVRAYEAGTVRGTDCDDSRGPVGTRDWMLYWSGWKDRSAPEARS